MPDIISVVVAFIIACLILLGLAGYLWYEANKE
jgi:hypothetical protein